MNYFNAPLVAWFTAWLIAQAMKQVFRLVGRNRRIFGGENRAALLLSGGMPSSHAAVVIALATYIAWSEGLDSTMFALSLAFAAIVIYDSLMVRFSSGQQGDALNTLLKEQKSKLWPLRVAHGHTPIEAIAGAVIGAIVGSLVFFTTI